MRIILIATVTNASFLELDKTVFGILRKLRIYLRFRESNECNKKPAQLTRHENHLGKILVFLGHCTKESLFCLDNFLPI